MLEYSICVTVTHRRFERKNLVFVWNFFSLSLSLQNNDFFLCAFACVIIKLAELVQECLRFGQKPIESS